MKFTTKPMTPVDFAPGIIEKVGEKVVAFDGSTVLIVTDEILVKLGMVDKVIDSLEDFGLDYVVFDKVLPDPPEHLVYEAVKVYEDNDCDTIVAIGGGSSMDVGKMTRLMLANEGTLMDWIDFNKPQKVGPKLICIPTTSGTGSEVTMAAVFTKIDTNVKHCIAGDGTRANLALVDPELAAGMPKKLTVATGFDTLAHGVETYICNFANGYSDMFAEKAIMSTLKYLGAAVEDGSNIEYRSEISRACTFAGIGLSDAGLTAGHSMAHSLGATYHIPHGVACSLALPWLLDYMAVAVPTRTRELIRMFGGDSEVAEDNLGETIRELVIDYTQSLELPLLYEIEGAKEEDIHDLAEKAYGDIFGFLTPRNLEVSDYEFIFKQMLDYRR